MAVCKYHQDRAGVGLCVHCRVAICAECCTRLDGINYCHACLKALGRREQPARSRSVPVTFLSIIVLTVTGLALFGIAWFAQGGLAP